jgi:hypothetical protein
MSEWQPIETAPTGTTVLAWFGRVGMGYNVLIKDTQNNWHEAVDDGRSLKEGYEPSHWMPLPPPPSTTST